MVATGDDCRHCDADNATEAEHEPVAALGAAAAAFADGQSTQFGEGDHSAFISFFIFFFFLAWSIGGVGGDGNASSW